MWLSGWGTVPRSERSLVWFRSGPMPGLQARSLVWGLWEATDRCFSLAHWCLSPSLSPSLPLSLKINKIFFQTDCFFIDVTEPDFQQMTYGDNPFLKQKPYNWYRGDVSLPWLAFLTLQTCQKTIFYTMLNAKTKNGSTVLWQLLHLECVLSNTI